MAATILLGSFVLFMMAGVPVAYAMGLASLLGALWIDLPLDAVMIQLASGVNKFALLAVPFFLLTANLMSVGGITDRLVALYTGADLMDPLKPGLTRTDQIPYPGAYRTPVPRASGGGGLVSSLADTVALRLHLLACQACPTFERQVLTMRNALRQWRHYSENADL